MCAPSLLPVRKEIKKGRKRKEERPAKKRASCNRLHLLRRSLCRPSDQPATSTKRPFALPSRCARRVCVCSVYACLSAAAVRCSFPSHYRLGYTYGEEPPFDRRLGPSAALRPVWALPFSPVAATNLRTPFFSPSPISRSTFFFIISRTGIIYLALHYSKCD